MSFYRGTKNAFFKGVFLDNVFGLAFIMKLTDMVLILQHYTQAETYRIFNVYLAHFPDFLNEGLVRMATLASQCCS